MHRHNCFGSGGDILLNRRYVNTESLRLYINKHRCQPKQPNYFRCRYIGEASCDHFISRLKAEGHHGNLKCVGTICTRYHMSGTEICLQCGLKFLYGWTVDEGG